MKLRYGIASFRRPECKTIDTLVRAGVSLEDICVALQDRAELNAYRAKHPDVRYIVREADCAAGNRNTLIGAMGAPVVLMDDDISSFAIKRPGTNFKRVVKREEFEPEFVRAIEEATANRCCLMGVAATGNDLVARGRSEYSYDVLLQGSFVVVLKDGVRFDERWKMVEDYELSLRAILHGHTLRANYISVNKPQNGTNAGGLHDRYARGELTGWIEMLAKQYPMFKPNKAKTGGQVRFG